MHVYAVGQPYTNRRTWPELAQYNYRAGEYELVLFLKHPNVNEVQAVQNGPFEMRLYAKGRLIVLAYRFGDAIPWSDAPYSIHLVPPEQRILPPEPMPGTRDSLRTISVEGADGIIRTLRLSMPDAAGALLHIVLVDAADGIIRALRAISMPPEFTSALYAAINAQYQTPFTRADYNGDLENLYARATSADLADLASIGFSSMPVGEAK